MITFDTNVLSALMRSNPDPPVVDWLNLQAAQSVWITSITLFESRLGLALLPAGRRRKTLTAAFDRLLEEDLENRLLPFDSPAALLAIHSVGTLGCVFDQVVVVSATRVNERGRCLVVMGVPDLSWDAPTARGSARSFRRSN